MKSRYNLRIQSIKPLLSSTKKKSSRITKTPKVQHVNSSTTNRRHSLRLTSAVKETKPKAITYEISNKKADNKHLCQTPKWRSIVDDNENDTVDIIDDMDDDYDDEVLIRHHRLMLEEQKDRKLYERYIRGQRTLRRLQCRRTHTAHLKEATRNRLLRELERERRYTIHEKICAHLANHEIIYRHGCNIESKAMNWDSLEEEIPCNRNVGTIRELDVMIDNLKRVIHNSKTSISRPRLSVRERQNQRLKTNVPRPTETQSILTMSNSPSTSPTQMSTLSYASRVSIVRFADDQTNKLRANNSQRLTCIQNVLSHQSNTNHQNKNIINEIVSPMTSRKSFLRSKPTNSNVLEISPSKRRPLEKENYSIVSNPPSHSNIVLRATSPMVSIKHTASSASSRTYSYARKQSIINNSLATRRHTRLSANG
ncbi:unnamed protein product [Adineta ricciae]|uniref:Uncharacterized protein n=1 Tax=Adineta ricciae TaxID=249248 RepID=A0A813VJB8_ADIRI|nr:unnamed protein product [Adineta ricciae]